MKIKCPVNSKDSCNEMFAKVGLIHHLVREHVQDTYAAEYTKLLFKIHEKIEKYSPPNPEQDSDDVELLKSLLE